MSAFARLVAAAVGYLVVAIPGLAVRERDEYDALGRRVRYADAQNRLAECTCHVAVSGARASAVCSGVRRWRR